MYYRADHEGFTVSLDRELPQTVPGSEQFTQNYQGMSLTRYFNQEISEYKTNVENTIGNTIMTAPDRTRQGQDVEAEERECSGHTKTEHEIGQENVRDFCAGETLYSNLMEATSEALISGNLTPLIKEELKLSIQNRRMKEGKDELQVKFTTPEPYMLTDDEVERVKKRRIQNREAARRFRERQRSKGGVLQKECNKLESANTQLRYVLSQLRQERDKLRSTLESHLKVCPYRPPQHFYTSIFPSDNT